MMLKRRIESLSHGRNMDAASILNCSILVLQTTGFKSQVHIAILIVQQKYLRFQFSKQAVTAQ